MGPGRRALSRAYLAKTKKQNYKELGKRQMGNATDYLGIVYV